MHILDAPVRGIFSWGGIVLEPAKNQAFALLGFFTWIDLPLSLKAKLVTGVSHSLSLWWWQCTYRYQCRSSL